MGDFTIQLQALVEKYKAQADEVVELLVVKVISEIDDRSPVGDADYWKSKPPKGYIGGHFRGSWRLGVGQMVIDTKGTIDPSGAGTVSTAIGAIPEDAAGKVYFYSNALPYAQRIEDGWSHQAPQGVVGLTVLRWQEFVRDAVAEVKQ